MMRSWLLLALVTATGCSIDESGLLVTDGGGPSDVADDLTTLPDAMTDAALDAPRDTPLEVQPPPCTLSSPFANPTSLGAGVNTGAHEWYPTLSADELTIYFARTDFASYSGLYVATRATKGAAFGTAQRVTSVSSANPPLDLTPCLVGAFATLYFGSLRAGGGNSQIFRANGTNPPPDGWTGIGQSTALASGSFDWGPAWCGASSELWLSSNRGGAGGFDLFVSAGGTAAPMNVSAVNTAYDEMAPVLSTDGLVLYYASGTFGGTFNVWRASRASTSTLAFTGAAHVTDFDQPGSNAMPNWLSPDGCRMYFSTNRTGTFDVFVATRP
jgi:hypothetical protein